MPELDEAKRHQLAEAVRNACIKAARDGYQNAAIAGLCHEGAWEAAISAMQVLNLGAVMEQTRDEQP
ncbi:MAG TPA: acetyltransferase [Gammaproteobacteria bacterium]|nr:acetyltransferase [Gammaproteobacteria bacterium]